MTKVATKKKFPNKSLVYLNEYNLVHDNSAYLPLVSGCLHAHALTFPAIRDSYEFAPYSFKTDLPDNILSEIKTPEVVAFSLYTWSTNLSLHVAREIKLRNPNSLIIFGGGSVPHDPTQFMTDYPFIDICVRGEGELPFSDILMRNISSREFSNIPQISWRNGDKIEINSGEHPFERDLDKLPSPYIEGLFDQLIKENPQFNFQAILETNRGCPFKCTFCYWGKGGIGRRFKFHSLERVKQDIEWIGKNNIGYVFGADSNFGMHRRDIEIAQAIADVKKRYGSPQRFRVCYGKNTDENIYKAGKLLFDHGLDKGVNLSRQSNSKEVLANIKRGNIKMDTYRTLQTKFAKSGIPTWTELILGLPGETYDSFVEGVEDVLNSELKALFIYWLEALPNTDMADPDYQTKYGIKLKTTDIQPIHCAVASDGGIIESVPMVVETASMPHDQWRRTWKFSWLMLTFQSLGACSFISHFLRSVLDVPYTDFIRFLVDEASNVMPDSMIASEIGFYEKQLDLIYDGKGWGVEIEGYELYWFMEECSFLRIAEDKDRFFKDLEKLLNRFLDVRKITFDPVLISEVVRYQWLRMPSASLPPIQQWKFHYNIPEFMESVMTDECVEIREQSQILSTKVIDYKSDKNDFASKRVLFGRKNDDVLWSVNWFSGDAAPFEDVGDNRPSLAITDQEGVGVW